MDQIAVKSYHAANQCVRLAAIMWRSCYFLTFNWQEKVDYNAEKYQPL